MNWTPRQLQLRLTNGTQVGTQIRAHGLNWTPRQFQLGLTNGTQVGPEIGQTDSRTRCIAATAQRVEIHFVEIREPRGGQPATNDVWLWQSWIADVFQGGASTAKSRVLLADELTDTATATTIPRGSTAATIPWISDTTWISSSARISADVATTIAIPLTRINRLYARINGVWRPRLVTSRRAIDHIANDGAKSSTQHPLHKVTTAIIVAGINNKRFIWLSKILIQRKITH